MSLRTRQYVSKTRVSTEVKHTVQIESCLKRSVAETPKRLVCLVVSTLSHEPTWRLGEPEHAYCEYDSWNHLKTPWNAKRCCALNVGATELDEVLDENTPSDGPLL